MHIGMKEKEEINQENSSEIFEAGNDSEEEIDFTREDVNKEIALIQSQEVD